MKYKARPWQLPISIALVTAALLVLLPTAYTICNSFMSQDEIRQYYAMVNGAQGYAKLHMLPDALSLEAWYRVLLHTPEYLYKFWNSIFLCAGIVAGQLVLSCLGGFGFAKYNFFGKKVLFFVIIVVMLMPIQVTLVPGYIVLDKLRLLDSYWALILPAAFSPFGTFLMTQIFKGVPDEVIDAARLDGAGTAQIMVRILVPMGKGGLISLGLLCFIDAWNMVEQPIIYLKNVLQYPLSVFLAAMNTQNFTLSFACGVLAMLPVLGMFAFFNRELVAGIEFSGLK